MPDPIEHLRDVLGISDVLREQESILRSLRRIHHDLRSLMSSSTDLTAAVDALVAEDGEVKTVLADLVAKVQASGDPALQAAAQDAVDRVNAAVSDLHTAAQAAGVATAPPTA